MTRIILLVGGLLFGLSELPAAQEPPPVTGTIALEGTVNNAHYFTQIL